MLTVAKGPTSYEEIQKIGEIQHHSFIDACFAMGFLDDDREFIGAIREAYQWGSRFFHRRLFVILLLSRAMNRPTHVWRSTIHWLSDGILHAQRVLAKNQGMLLNYFQHSNMVTSILNIMLILLNSF